jgi:polysaccharide export outer membrane protein
MDRVGMSLAEALASSGGFNAETSDASGVFVLRIAPSKEKLAQIYQLDVSDATALVLADRFKLQSSDIVFVTSTAISKWNRVVKQLLPTAQFLWYGARLSVDGNSLANTLGQ